VTRNSLRSAYYSRASFENRQLLRQRRRRPTVEKLADDCLDVRELQRAGIFRDGWVTLRPFLRWSGIVQMRAARYLIQLELSNQVTPQQIRVSWTRCHFGGDRPWLHCSFCKRRVAKLFHGMGAYFCRPCIGNPIYASQAKSTQSRRHFEACKLRLRLDGIASLTAPFPERPRGMHRKTYARLRHRGEKLEAGLSARLRAKPADYPNLIYYLPSDFQLI
jgi:hypothetical protein